MFGRSQWCIALEFDPDRFLDERHAKYLLHNPFIFLPFNAGWYTFTQWHDRLSLCYPIRTSNMSRPTICLQRNLILPHPTTPNIFLHLACQRRTAPRYAPSGILEGVRRSSGYRGVHGAESFSDEYKSKLIFMLGRMLLTRFRIGWTMDSNGCVWGALRLTILRLPLSRYELILIVCCYRLASKILLIAPCSQSV